MTSKGLKTLGRSLILTGMLFCAACGSGNEADAGSQKEDKQASTLKPLKNSFVVNEGRKSNIICMVTDRRGHVFAAAVADRFSVIYQLDQKLKSIRKMAKFGSVRGNDPVTDMAIDSRGNIFVAGYTRNSDFPLTEGSYWTQRFKYQTQAYVVKFSPKLELLASTFVQGGYNRRAQAIAVDEHDNVLVAGYIEGGSHSRPKPFLPPPGAFDRKPAPNFQSKAFILKLSNDLTSLKAATFLGGDAKKYDSDDEIHDLALDPDGNVWVTGQTNSDDFPVTPGCIQVSYSGKGDVFVSKFNANLSRLVASTYLGGMNQELATALVVNKKGSVYVGGWTESPNLPMVQGSYDTRYSHEEEDGFIVKLSGDLKQLKAATYLGGDYDASGYGDDLISALALSADGKTICATGRTESENFPVTPKCYKSGTNDNDTAFGHDNHRNFRKPRERGSGDEDYGDGFITLFNADLTQCRYSTYFGGDNLEYVDDILFYGNDLLVAGITYSYDFPRITTKEKSKTGARGFAVRFNWRKNR